MIFELMFYSSKKNCYNFEEMYVICNRNKIHSPFSKFGNTKKITKIPHFVWYLAFVDKSLLTTQRIPLKTSAIFVIGMWFSGKLKKKTRFLIDINYYSPEHDNLERIS